jgi:hypothetical protein
MAAHRPFRFETAAVLTRLTNRRARSLRELRDGLQVATGSMVFHHTYNALLDRHFVAGAPQNDFVHWVDRTLRLRALAERLDAIDVYDFTDLQELRKDLVRVLDDHLANGGESPSAAPEEEFHFLESVSVATPTPFLAEDLAGFRDALSRVGIRSIYHHFLTARLRMGRKSNDFSTWLEESLDEQVLARAFERIDPGVGTLEDARARMVQLVDGALGTRKRTKVLSLGLLSASVLGALAAGARGRGKGKGDHDRHAR